MLFNSTIFVALLLLTFFVYYLPFALKYQVPVLIISSLIFYGYEQPALLLLLLFSASVNITASYYVAYGSPARRKLYATSGVVINLFMLCFFKYSPLFAKTFFSTDSGIGHFLLMVPLPLGISFYAFEGISLLIDVYSNKHRDVLTIDKSLKKHLYKTLFFISFFPHLIAGPILKAYQFYPQIGAKKLAGIDWNYVFKKLVLGYFLKMVIADNLSKLTFWMEYPYFKTLASKDLVMLIFAYSFQIFADFAGYSLIALGLAKLYGYNLVENFNFPYIATSFSEFWRRWHISLSTFLKEYLYIPLGGNRKGKFRTYINLIITMGLGGLWHGAGWSYALWGLFHGAALAGERFVINNFTLPKKNIITSIAGCAIVFTTVSVAWVLFKLPIAHVADYFSSILYNRGFPSNANNVRLIKIYSIPVILYHAGHLVYSSTRYAHSLRPYEFVVYGCLLFMIVVNSGPSGSFIYFQF